MTDLVIYLLIIVLGLSIGFFIGKLMEKSKSEKENSELKTQNSLLQQAKESAENSLTELQKEIKFIQQEKENLISDRTRLQTEYKNTEKKLAENKGELEKLNKPMVFEA